MAEVVPDRAFKQIAFQPEERRRREQVVEPYRAGLLLSEALHQRVAIWPVADRGPGKLRCTANVDRRVVVLAEPFDLFVGKRRGFFRDAFRNLLIVSRQRLEALTVAAALRQITKLLRVVQELVARRLGQAFGRDAGSVFAAPEFVGPREMIERAAPVAFRKPQESERAMGVIVPGLERADAAEILDGLARLAERLMRNGAVVVRRRVLRLGGDRIVEMADGGTMPALGRGKHAEVMRDGGMAGARGSARRGRPPRPDRDVRPCDARWRRRQVCRICSRPWRRRCARA